MSRTTEPPDAGSGAGATTDPPPGELPPGELPPADLPLAETRAGRRLLNVVAVVLLGAMFVSNLPDSELRDEFRLVERPITDLTGLNQNWALFAPNPRSTFLRLRAEVERADGSVEEWTPPVGDRAIGVYRTYRWRKWANQVVDPDSSLLHRGAAAYLRAELDDPDRPPITEVRIYRDVHRQPRPGSGEPADRAPDFEEELLLRSISSPEEDAA